MRALRDQLKMDDFKVDPKQMDDLKQQMEQWQKSYSPDTFKFDQKQIDNLKKQMEQFRKDYTAQDQPIGPN